MKTAEHILTWQTIVPTALHPFSKRAWCNCGKWKSDARCEDDARTMHAAHVQEMADREQVERERAS